MHSTVGLAGCIARSHNLCSNSLLIYASFSDGNIVIFDADNLKLRCRVAPSAYMPKAQNPQAYPLVVAAHPYEPNQFAVGLSDGSIQVVEPSDLDSKWGVSAPYDNGTTSTPNGSRAVAAVSGTSEHHNKR